MNRWRRLLVRALLPPLAGCAAVTMGAQPGSVDPTFDPGRGARNIRPGEGHGVLIQPDGKIIVGGNFNAVGTDELPPLVRFNPDGSLDPTFDTSALRPGKIRLDRTTDLIPIALQPDGRVLIAPGSYNQGYGSRALIRLEPNGTVDSAFTPQFASSGGGFAPHVDQVVVGGDGSLLVSGIFTSVNGVTRERLARLHADGSVDQTFTAARTGAVRVLSTGKLIVGREGLYRLNSDGSVDDSFKAELPSMGFYVWWFVVQPDDKIIYAQQVDFWGTTVARRLNADGSQDPSFQPFYDGYFWPYFLQSDGKLIIGNDRLNSDGSRDPTFQLGDVGSDHTAFPSIAQQPDGRLILAARFNTQPYGVRRLLADGSLDPSFTPGVGLTTIVQAAVGGAQLLPSGKIIIAGVFNRIDYLRRICLAVVNQDGTPDPEFDAGNLLNGSYFSNSAPTVSVQSDGKIFIAFDGQLVRLNSDGTRDSSFAYTSRDPGSVGFRVWEQAEKLLVSTPDGLVRLTKDGTRDFSFQAAAKGAVFLVEPNGRIVINHVMPSDVPRKRERLVRLQPDGDLDSGFEFDPALISTQFDGPRTITLLPDGKYLFSRWNSFAAGGLFRLNSDGSKDDSFSANIASVGIIRVDRAGITVAGDTRPEGVVSDQRWAFARLNHDGTRDPAFQPSQVNPGASVTQLLLQEDGNFIITGDFERVGDVNRNGIARMIGGAPRQIANVSTRARVAAGEGAEIAGFIISGEAAKKVVIRALGPSLGRSGIIASAMISDPLLTLHDATGAVIAQNDNWRDAQAAEIAESGVAPEAEVEAAIVAKLSPGSYTAIIRDRTGGEGLALAEVYDLEPLASSTLANISTRGSVGSGENVMIGGFILRGSEPSAVVIRALGPSLSSAGVADPLDDPSLTLHDASGAIVAANDNWKQTQQEELEAIHMDCPHENDAAVLTTLPSGAYTAVVRGQSSGCAIGLVEVYRLQ